jgi:hypothetical protein
MILFNLIEIFAFSLMVAFAINSFKLASQDGMIFGKFYNWILCHSTYYWVYRYRERLKKNKSKDCIKNDMKYGPFELSLTQEFKQFLNTEIDIIHAPLDYIQKRKIYYILKPILFCPTCMSSVWSLPVLFIEPIYFPFVVICTSVIATLIYDKLFPNYE